MPDVLDGKPEAPEGRDQLLRPAGEDRWIGRVLAKVYRVEEKIGEGGMGAVYRATHVHLKKSYAIKVLTEAGSALSSAVERLEHEAIAASSIEHDNIVEVVSLDRADDGAVFLVMECLRGESLAARLNRGPIPLEESLHMLRQITSALGAAHALGIVHRDLKPENIFIARRGDEERVKVLDFGISKIRTAEAEQIRLTRTGQLVGTPLYMSPEQARGESEVDERADVYAVGALAYEMLTGSPPFSGRNHFELLYKHGHETPEPPRTRNPQAAVPEALEMVILRALSKAPEDRQSTMERLGRDLANALPSPEQGTAKATGGFSHVPRTSSAVQKGALVAAALVGLVALLALRSRPSGPAENAVFESRTSAPPSLPSPAAQLGVEETELSPTTPTTDLISMPVYSIPSQAEVWREERLLGRTPLLVEGTVGGGSIELRVRKDGYRETTLHLVPRQPAEAATVRLLRRAPEASPNKGRTLPIKERL